MNILIFKFFLTSCSSWRDGTQGHSDFSHFWVISSEFEYEVEFVLCHVITGFDPGLAFHFKVNLNHVNRLQTQLLSFRNWNRKRPAPIHSCERWCSNLNLNSSCIWPWLMLALLSEHCLVITFELILKHSSFSSISIKPASYMALQR